MVKQPSIYEIVFEKYLKNKGISFKKEYSFTLDRQWRFDYAIRKHKIAIEVEGGVYVYGAHNRPKHFISDMEKYNAAAILGWKVLRYIPQHLGRAIFDIDNILGLSHD